MEALLRRAVAPPPPVSYPDLDAWWRDHLHRTAPCATPIDRAIVGALAVDRVAWAFAGGYAAALEALLPAVPRDALGAFAATEEGGSHPRAIRTTLTDGRLRGSKRWVTMPRGPRGSFFVVARRPDDDPAGRPRLVLVRVPADAPGVAVSASPAAVVPELAHGTLALDVAIDPDAVLPGDGYADYLKPFRTVEDLHVHGALAALALALAHRVDGPRGPRERLLATLPAIRALALDDPRDPAVHLALGGVLGVVEESIAALEPAFERLDPASAAAWSRDRALRTVAARARGARLEAAWTGLASPAAPQR